MTEVVILHMVLLSVCLSVLEASDDATPQGTGAREGRLVPDSPDLGEN